MGPIQNDSNLNSLSRQAQASPLLSEEAERALVARWRDHQDPQAKDALLRSYLRLVLKVARLFRGYGLDMDDLTAEGNLGLVRALETFDPSRELRFSTYAQWWVRAAMYDHVLRFSTPVTFGLSAGRKRLFFKLRSLKSQILHGEDRALTDQEAAELARNLQVKTSSVLDMERLLSQPSRSFDAPIGEDGDSYGANFADLSPNAEDILGDQEEYAQRRTLLRRAMDRLNPRERDIVMNRSLQETPLRLEDLARRYGISRERVRQIESTALSKISQWIRRQAPDMVCYA